MLSTQDVLDFVKTYLTKKGGSILYEEEIEGENYFAGAPVTGLRFEKLVAHPVDIIIGSNEKLGTAIMIENKVFHPGNTDELEDFVDAVIYPEDWLNLYLVVAFSPFISRAISSTPSFKSLLAVAEEIALYNCI